MDALFPGKKKFTRWGDNDEVIARWEKPALDWKAKVVCRQCNNTWMSGIETDHAKPALTDLIIGKVDIPITRSRAGSIALFAFKTAVVFNHIASAGPPFFTRTARGNFREIRAIPWNVNMWMAGFLPIGKGLVHACYHKGMLPNGNRIKLYVCTYAVGHFVFQVLGARQGGFTPFGPREEFEQLAVPFWPNMPNGFVWPPVQILRTADDFYRFSVRWKDLVVPR